MNKQQKIYRSTSAPPALLPLTPSSAGTGSGVAQLEQRCDLIEENQSLMVYLHLRAETYGLQAFVENMQKIGKMQKVHKAFECHVCPQRYETRSGLRRHIINKHGKIHILQTFNKIHNCHLCVLVGVSHSF